MLAEAAGACFYAGEPAEMLAVAERALDAAARRRLARRRFLAATALGMARIIGGDAAAGAEAIARRRSASPKRRPSCCEDLRLLPWLAMAPIFLREAATGRGRCSMRRSMRPARRAAIGALPIVLGPDRPRPGDHRPLGRGGGHLRGGDRRWRARATSGPTSRSRSPGWPGCTRGAGASGSAARAPTEALALCEHLGTRLFEVGRWRRSASSSSGRGEAVRGGRALRASAAAADGARDHRRRPLARTRAGRSLHQARANGGGVPA